MLDRQMSDMNIFEDPQGFMVSMDKATIKEYWEYMLSKAFITQSEYNYNITMLEPLDGFIMEGINRKEAYNNFIAFEKSFEDAAVANTEMSFEEFCAELDKGYASSNSRCTQIARLWEDSKGRVWYDKDYS